MRSTILILVAIILLLLAYIFYTRMKNISGTPLNFVFSESNESSDEYLPVVSETWMREIEMKYKDNDWNQYDNPYTQQAQVLCTEVYKNWNGEVSHSAFLNKLTKAQRMYLALVTFEAQTNNGGVYQFLFNYPELSVVVLDAMQSAGMTQLAADYETVLNQFFGKSENISDLQTKFQDGSLKWEKRWEAFAEGYKELPAAATIEEYFYEEDFSKAFSEKMVDFAKENQRELFRVKSNEQLN